MNKLLKILLLIMVTFSIAGCELFDPKGWREAREDMRKRDVQCYEEANGNVYCKDKYGDRY